MRQFYCLLLFLFCAQQAAGQDTHYWSSNFGTGGFLTPGAAIADTRDSGVFFYNPALLAVRPKNSLELSGDIYQLESTKITDGVGKGKDLKSISTVISPQILSGNIAFKRNRRIALAYALIHSHIINDKVTQRQDTRLNVLNDFRSPGSEFYIGQFHAQNSITEIAGVLSAGLKIFSKFYIGASLEAQLRKQIFDKEYSGRALENAFPGSEVLFPPLVNSESVYRIDYTQVSLKPKIGVAYNTGRHHVGLLVTLPLLRLVGQGTLMSDDVVTNIRLSETASPINFLANTRQEKLKTNYKTPLSVAAGYAYDLGRGQVYVAVEYFAKIREYNVLTPRDEYFIRPDTGSINSTTSSLLAFKDARKAVTNVAVGLSFPVRPTVMGYVAVRTNFSSADRTLFADEDGYEAYTTYWNNFHGQIGVNIKRENNHFRPGLLLSYGATRNYRQEVNFDNPNESNLLLGVPGDTKATSFSVGFLLSYIRNL